MYVFLCASSGSVATAEDPAAIATIQSAATFTDQPIKYLFKAEGAGGQVRRCLLKHPIIEVDLQRGIPCTGVFVVKHYIHEGCLISRERAICD